MRKVVGSLFALALGWSLWHYGATETWAFYAFFLALLPSAALAVWSFPRWDAGWRLLPFAAVGLLVLTAVAALPSLEARGFVQLGIGWSALAVGLAVAAPGHGDRPGRGHRGATALLVGVLVLFGACEAVLGWAQVAGAADPVIEPLPWASEDSVGNENLAGQATGTLVNRNHFAGLLNMALALALGVLAGGFARRRSRVRAAEAYAWTWLMLLVCAAIAIAVLLSRSRGGVLTLFALLAFLAGLMAWRRRGASGRGASGGLSGAAVGVLLVLVVGLGLAAAPEVLLQRFQDLGGDGGTSRLAVYRDTLGLIGDHPWTGVGPGMYRWAFRPYQTAPPRILFDHAHNDYLETAAEYGVPAALLFWAFVLRRLQRSVAVFLASRSAWRQGLALGTAGAIFSIVLHSLVDFNLRIPSHTAFFGAVLGLAWSLDLRAGGQEEDA